MTINLTADCLNEFLEIGDQEDFERLKSLMIIKSVLTIINLNKLIKEVVMLKVYAAKWCPHCTKTVEYLQIHFFKLYTNHQ
ncbi:hypothetical protein QUF70_02805 [Desulfobacterales bacterium HSG17]|nr:hypothetical protein [Desulfobacterales bacterium HSG17]